MASKISKVAVIVPVYNVENYLIACVESLTKQTFSDYMIYLIDDGSTDSSGDLCDLLAKKHKRIVVYHKKNGGLSDARNYGVKIADESLITFVDSDDTVRDDYIERLYNAMKNSGASISVANYLAVSKPGKGRNSKRTRGYIIEGSSVFLKKAFLGKCGGLSACAKLFKKEQLLDHPFPVGKLYEDMEVVYNIMILTKTIAYVRDDLYYYLTRNGSIVQSRVTERHKYGIISCENIYNSLVMMGNYDLARYAACRLVKQACGYLPNLVRYNDINMFYEISKIVRPYILKIWRNIIAPLKLRVLCLAYLFPANVGIVYAKIVLRMKKIITQLVV